GAALTPEPAAAKGFVLERSFYTLDGTPVDLTRADGQAATLKQNERLVVVLRFKGDHPGGRLMVTDRLPAGLQIENPRLIDSGNVAALPWLKTKIRPRHTQFRDDRFLAAFDLFKAPRGAGGTGPDVTVAYMVRAVTPGTYVHPAATVEDMYRPERFARTVAGRLIVEPAR
ncbi:MAG: hypothetical protein AAFR04_07710, partial [Pseudomonadota bacterium]